MSCPTFAITIITSVFISYNDMSIFFLCCVFFVIFWYVMMMMMINIMFTIMIFCFI